ncbi:hypothetical protein [Proteus phage PM135]|uniref:Uncharacterized protein n=1 Tax=Proteus phage PM135 TaxID=2048008 RepID=A0A2H4PRR3_9CAUD|nr:hypothetical protein FDJ15_gp100 [Proteus phage PM135]ATW69983.1 hypothetical protein [Proteus phage PM135]
MEDSIYLEARNSLIYKGKYDFSYLEKHMYSKDVVDLATKVISRLEKEFNVNYKIDRGIIGPLDIRVWKVTNNVIEDWLD